MGAGKLSPLGRQPGRSDGEHFPPILGRKASWSSFRRNSPNSRNGALLEVSPGDMPSHHPATRCPGWAAASGTLGFPAAPRHAPPALLSLIGCFAILPAQDLHPGSARPAAKSRWQVARLPHSASLQPCPAQPRLLADRAAQMSPPEGTPSGGGQGEELYPPSWQLSVVMQQQEGGRRWEGPLGSPQKGKQMASCGVPVSGRKGGRMVKGQDQTGAAGAAAGKMLPLQTPRSQLGGDSSSAGAAWAASPLLGGTGAVPGRAR